MGDLKQKGDNKTVFEQKGNLNLVSTLEKQFLKESKGSVPRQVSTLDYAGQELLKEWGGGNWVGRKTAPKDFLCPNPQDLWIY